MKEKFFKLAFFVPLTIFFLISAAVAAPIAPNQNNIQIICKLQLQCQELIPTHIVFTQEGCVQSWNSFFAYDSHAAAVQIKSQLACLGDEPEADDCMRCVGGPSE